MTSERNPEEGFMNQKKKTGKSVPTETEYPIIETAENVSSIRKWNKRKTVIVGNSLLVEIEEKRISGNRSVKARISPPRNNSLHV